MQSKEVKILVPKPLVSSVSSLLIYPLRLSFSIWKKIIYLNPHLNQNIFFSKFNHMCFSGYLITYRNACGSLYFASLYGSSSNPVYYSYIYLNSLYPNFFRFIPKVVSNNIFMCSSLTSLNRQYAVNNSLTLPNRTVTECTFIIVLYTPKCLLLDKN